MESIEIKMGICNKIVLLFNTWWILFGWMLFFCAIGLWLFSVVISIYIWMLSLLLFAVWWIIDVIDQAVPMWQIFIGVLAIIAFFVVGAPCISVVWVIYLTRIRDQ